MKTVRHLAITALAAFALAGCSKDDIEGETLPTGNTGDIVFNISIAGGGVSGEGVKTRAATAADFRTTFEDGDEVGVFAVKRAGGGTASLAASGNYIHNVKLTYSTADGGTWTTSDSLFHAGGGYVLDFYAYYPYDDNGGSPQTLDPAVITFNVQPDQTTAADYSKSDLLSANHSGVAKGTAVDLTFAHKLALVQVEVDATWGDPNEELNLTLRGCATGATLDLNGNSGAGSVTTNGDAQAIKMLRVEQPGDADYLTKYTYRALVPAQTIAEDSKLALMENGDNLFTTAALAASLNLEAGKAEQYQTALPFHIAYKRIPAGTFMMGSSDGSNTGNTDDSGLNTTSREPNRDDNETQHWVTLTKDFYMSKYQITNTQYAAFLNANSIGNLARVPVEGYGNQTLVSGHTWGVRWDATNSKWVAQSGYENHPVINVTWYGAKAFADWIGGSLPTEAQWEYACRGGQSESLPFGIGTGRELTGNMANFYATYPYDLDYTTPGSYNDDAQSSLYKGKTTPVGYYSSFANGYGLYDMHGNVYEWCLDSFANYPTGTTQNDPVIDPVQAGSIRVVRGGDWYSDAQYCRSAFRHYANPGSANDRVGFRVAVVP